MAVFPVQQVPLILLETKMWLNASYVLNAVTANPADATPISSWANLDGNIMTCGQASATNQPLFKTNIAAGKPALLFDGSNDGMALTGTGPLTAAQRFASTSVFTMAFVFRALVTTGNAQCLEAMRGAVATDKTTLGIDATGNLYWEVNNAGVITTIATAFSDTTNPHIVLVTNDGASGLTMYLDGVQITGGAATSGTSGTANTVEIGNIPVAFTRAFNGYIFDFFHSGKILTTDERNQLTTFFSNFYGVSI